MRVNSVNSVSFSGKNKKTYENKNKSVNYKYISQNSTVEALKMSVGREEEDGKYKFAGNTAMTAGLLGSMGAFCSKLTINDKAIKLVSQQKSQETAKTAEEFTKSISKLSKKSAVAEKVLLASSAAIMAGLIIQDVNRAKANKTANERGFLSQKDKNNIKTPEEIFEITDLIYNANIRKTDR